MSESKTPRTKAAELELIRNNPGLDEKRVMAAFDFARTLELELNEAREDYEQCSDVLNNTRLHFAQVASDTITALRGEQEVNNDCNLVNAAKEFRKQLTTAQQEIVELKRESAEREKWWNQTIINAMVKM